MEEDLLVNDRHINGCQGWGAGEDQDAEDEKLTDERGGDDSG
jgi:hypothetical protein